MKLNLESVRAIVDKQNDKIYYVIQDLQTIYTAMVVISGNL